MDFAPDGRLFVLEQAGNVELVRADGTTWTALHLNVDSQGERGLLGIAFDPAFESNHFVYLYYTNPGPGAAPWATGEHNQLSRFTVDDSDPARPVFEDEAPILDWDNLSAATNHNGGAIHFGLDGMLYADAGDNLHTFTQGGNTYRVSQTLSDLLGKQLRIDVSAFNQGVAMRNDATVGHLIPSDNPFVGIAPGIDQLIYCLGLRNPFTFAVQPGTGTIFINDVGESTWEEIDQSVPGANFGWSGGNTDGFGQSPPGPGVYHDPLLAYNHTGGPAGGGIAIVGGTFYDPPTPQFPASYAGKYFYADLSAGWIRVFDAADPGTASNPDTSSPFATGIVGTMRDLKVDQAGNLYYLTGSGTVEKVSFEAPGIETQPVDQTVTEGRSATFTVAASGAALTYQWQHLVGVTSTDVGTNSPSFTIAAAATADAGAYRVIVTNSAGSVISDTVVLTVSPVTPPVAPGLKAEFFDFRRRLKAMPNLAGLVAGVTRTDAVIDYLPAERPWAGLDARFADSFALRETGFLEVSTPGRYKLSLRSKDGAKLWLDGTLLVNNGGIHPVRARSKGITLTAGLHTLRVDFFANTGVAALILSWSGPGIAQQVVPATDLLHATAAVPAASLE
jgi:glucose/arabinose dehydrogenase